MSNLIENEFDQNSLQDWQQLATKSLRDSSLAELAHVTASGLAIEPLYTTRPNASEPTSAQPMQRWDNRLPVIGDTAQAQNNHALEGLGGGVDSLQITLDSPEHPTPVKIEQLHTVLNNVQLDIIPVSLFAGSQFIDLANNVKEIWSKQGAAADKTSVSFNADPIGTLASTGSLRAELHTLLQDMSTLATTTHQAFSHVRTVCVNSVCYHNAGATIEQEIVSAIATGAIYLETLIDAGLDPQVANDTIAFQVASDADAITNVIKLRTLKQLWLHLGKQFDVPAPHLHLVIETSARMQSCREPWVNHLRNVSAATAAAMGDADCIIIHPHNRIDNQFIDDQIELGARVARNIPIILSEESALTFVHDPMAGSYAVETLTTNLINASWQALQQLETDGGLIDALTSGRWQKAIAASQKNRVARLIKTQDIQVGVNKFSAISTSPIKLSTSPSPQQIELLMQVPPLMTARDAIEFEA